MCKVFGEYAKWTLQNCIKCCVVTKSHAFGICQVILEYAELTLHICLLHFGKHCQRIPFSPEDLLDNSEQESVGHFVKQRRALSPARGPLKMAPWLKASRGFEPRSLDSGSRVLAVTPRGQLWFLFFCYIFHFLFLLVMCLFQNLLMISWVHSSVVRAADRRSAGPWFKSGCALCDGRCETGGQCSSQIRRSRRARTQKTSFNDHFTHQESERT